MATTDVILREKIEGLGSEADVVSVKRGFARNFLIPTGRAFEATKSNLRHIATLSRVRAEREAAEMTAAETIATKLRKMRLKLELAIGQGGKAFGSITPSDLLDAINKKGKLSLEKKQLQWDKAIKSTGDFEIPVKVYQDIDATVSLTVKAEEPKEEGA